MSGTLRDEVVTATINSLLRDIQIALQLEYTFIIEEESLGDDNPKYQQAKVAAEQICFLLTEYPHLASNLYKEWNKLEDVRKYKRQCKEQDVDEHESEMFFVSESRATSPCSVLYFLLKYNFSTELVMAVLNIILSCAKKSRLDNAEVSSKMKSVEELLSKVHREDSPLDEDDSSLDAADLDGADLPLFEFKKWQLASHVLSILAACPALATETYFVESVDPQRERSKLDKELAECGAFSGNQELVDTSCGRSVLYFFIKSQTPLKFIKLLLALCTDPHKLLSQHDNMPHISTMHLACKHATSDTITYLARTYPHLVDESSILLAAGRPRGPLPFSLVELLYETTTVAHPFIQYKLLLTALKEKLPAYFMRRLVRSYSHHSLIVNGIDSISASEAMALSPLFSKVKTICLPKVEEWPQLEAFAFWYLLDDLLDESCGLVSVKLTLPNVFVSGDAKPYICQHLEKALRENTSLREIDFTCDNENEKTHLAWFQSLQEGIANNKNLRVVRFRAKSGAVAVSFSLHPLLLAPRSSLDPHQQRQLGDLETKMKNGHLPREASFSVNVQEVLDDNCFKLVCELINNCRNPSLTLIGSDREAQLSKDTMNATEMVKEFLQKCPRLLGLRIAGASIKVDPLGIFDSLDENTTLKSFILDRTRSLVAPNGERFGDTDYEKIKAKFLELVKTGVLCRHLFKSRQPDAATFYYLQMNSMGRKKAGGEGTSTAEILDLILGSKDEPSDFSNGETSGSDRNECSVVGNAPTARNLDYIPLGMLSDFRENRKRGNQEMQTIVTEADKKDYMWASIIYGILIQGPTLWNPADKSRKKRRVDEEERATTAVDGNTMTGSTDTP